MVDENKNFVSRNDACIIQQIREAAGLSRKEFAKSMGVDYDTVWAWETGRQQPSLSLQQVGILSRYAKHVGIDLGDIPDNLIN
jgi:DNA-binding transcriptional regulator YiaG